MQNTYTNEILQGVSHMDDLKNQKAVEHNDLVTSVAKMDKIPLKIFELAVSHLNTETPPKDNVVYLSKSVIFSFFNVSSSSKHTRFKNALTTLHQQSVFEVRNENEKGKFSYSVISPISSSQWNDRNDLIKIKFTDEIIPYLIELKANFTQYLITDIMELNSKYSIILYKWFSMNYNQYDTYKSTNQRTKTQLDKLKNPYIEIKELRRITNTVEEYKRMYDFEKNVLQLAKNEINQSTHFVIDYEKIKKGRSIVGIKFYIRKKQAKAPLFYKEEDLGYQEDKLAKKAEKEALYTLAIQNKYTTLLGENFLIGFKDMQDTSLMANLQIQVYPLYNELKKSRGIKGVKEHISYVATHQYGFSSAKKNIVKYLRLSIEQYMQTIKTQNIE